MYVYQLTMFDLDLTTVHQLTGNNWGQ